MDDKAKKALIKKLSTAGNFDLSYSPENRTWFVGRVISILLAKNVADDQIENETSKVLSKSKAIVQARKNFELALSVKDDYASERDDVQRRVEILYGVIAEDVRFADADGSNFASRYFNFIAARRYRAVVRMAFYVNPNDQGYFWYPAECQRPGFLSSDFQLNTKAQPYWERINPNSPIPLRLKAQGTTGVAPALSIDKIWTPTPDDPCDGNLLDCETAMSCVLMDSLLEAKNRDSLLKAMADMGSNYLLIHLITSYWQKVSGPTTPITFLNDRGPNTLFFEEHVDPADLQVGDHIYVWNHPLYAKLDPIGVWRGEHAVVTNCGNRRFDDGLGIKVTGHGVKPETLAQLRDELWKDINTMLNLVYNKALIFLRYKAAGDKAPPGAVVTFEDHDLSDGQGNTVHARICLFKMDFAFQDYRAIPMGSNNKPVIVKKPGFLVSYMPDQNVCAFPFLAESIADVATNQALRAGTVLVQTATPKPNQSQFDPVLWAIPYEDPMATPNPPPYPLFGKAKSRITFQMLKSSEMPNPPFGRMVPDAKGVLVTRPKINLDSAAYQTFLTKDGRI